MALITSESILLLAPRARSARHNGRFDLEGDSTTFTFEGRSAKLFEEVVPFLDGSRPLAKIAGDFGVQIDELTALLSAVDEEFLLLDTTRIAKATSATDFMAALFQECAFWSKEIFSQPFWTSVLSGTAPKEVIFGWGIEFYHFVESANRYMAAGAANCREDSVIREWFVKHYIEECDHGQIFIEGLGKCGLDTQKVINSPPLPSTRALINFLYELAISNSFSYAAAFAVMQPKDEVRDRLQAEKLYSRLTAMYPFAGEMFGAFEKHALIDVDLGHNEIVLEKICGRIPEQVFNARGQIMAAVRGVAEHFMLFFEGVQGYYSEPRTPVPRRMLASAEQL